MSEPAPVPPLVSVKFSRTGRVHAYLQHDAAPGAPIRPGERVVVPTADGPALARVVPTVPGLAARKPPEAAAVRRATPEDLASAISASSASGPPPSSA